LGAVIGPAIALAYLYYYPDDYTTLFIIAFFPGVLAILLTLFIKEKKPINNSELKKERWSFFALFSYWKVSSVEYKKLLIGLLLFATFNSSDVFLLLRMKESGFSDTAVIGVYIFYNLAFALLAYPIGILADKLGLKKIFLSGLFVFAIVYAGFAVNDNLIIFFILFFLYGLYAAATEGISKAWISNIVDKSETATAIGTYSGLQSICALLASSLTGFLWYSFGSLITFLITALVTLIVIIYLVKFHKPILINKKP
jgi:MFS family permease